MRLAIAALTGTLAIVLCQSVQPTLADDARAPLSGSVTVQTAPDEHMRLSRDEIPASANPQPTLDSAIRAMQAIEPRGILNGQLDSQSTQLLQRGFGRMDNSRPLTGQTQQQAFNLQAQQAVHHPPFAPYIWTQSRDGGYYDASGFIKGTVPGDQLRLYGGRFSDGTPVPMTNVGTNGSGHVWWQSGLTHPYFFNRNQSP